MNTLSPEQFKAATRQAWDKSASGWNAQTQHIHDWLAQATPAMLDAAHISVGMRVLDVAAGAGDQAREIRRWTSPGGLGPKVMYWPPTSHREFCSSHKTVHAKPAC